MKAKFQHMYQRLQTVRRMRRALWLRYDGYDKYAVEEMVEITQLMVKD